MVFSFGRILKVLILFKFLFGFKKEFKHFFETQKLIVKHICFDVSQEPRRVLRKTTSAELCFILNL